jgi:hypothetical protein
MTRPGLFWLAYALAYVAALACIIAWLMQRKPTTTTSVRPDVPAHQLSVNPFGGWE